jgi:hypothetical protein
LIDLIDDLLWLFQYFQITCLFTCLFAGLESYLQVSGVSVRITRVQLYEILDMNSQLEASQRPAVAVALVSPRSPKEKVLVLGGLGD